MLELLTLSAMFLCPPGDAKADLKVSPDAFKQWFDTAAAGKLTIPDKVSRSASRYRYVFISGLHFGMMQGYFQQNAKELRSEGVPRDSIHFVHPSSANTVDENAEFVRSEILAAAAEGPEKLVLIAHSRGACDALAFALQNPKFVTQRIEAMFLIQGPFGGTGLADYVAGDGEPIDKEMPLGYRVLDRTLGRLEAKLLDGDRHEAITALSHRASVEFWKDLVEHNRDAVPVVAPKTFYVTSRVSPSKHSIPLRATAWYLGTYYGPNDGLVTLEDQSLPGLGTVLAVLDVGHTDLTRRFPAARPKARLRRAIVDAIIMAVGAPEKPAAKKPAAADRSSDRRPGRSR
jgi:pimeloyl-ACP methyl ester carboxylesterase